MKIISSKNKLVKIEIEKIPSSHKIYSKTQIGIRPEFVSFSNSGIAVKILKVNNAGRHKIIDIECDGGKLKMISSVTATTPSGTAYVKFNSKYTYVYGDDWIVEE